MLTHIFKTVVFLYFIFVAFYPFCDKFGVKNKGNETCKDILHLCNEETWPELKNATSRVKTKQMRPNHTNNLSKPKDSRDSMKQKDSTNFVKQRDPGTFLKRDRDNPSKLWNESNYLAAYFPYYSSMHEDSENGSEQIYTDKSPNRDLGNFSKQLKIKMSNPNINTWKTFEEEGIENKSDEIKQNILESKYLSMNQCEKDKSIASYSKNQDIRVNRSFEKTYANILKNNNMLYMKSNDLNDENIEDIRKYTFKDSAYSENNEKGNQRDSTSISQVQHFKSLELNPNNFSSHFPSVTDEIYPQSPQYSSIFDENSPQSLRSLTFSSMNRKPSPKAQWSPQPALLSEKTPPEQTRFGLLQDKPVSQDYYNNQFSKACDIILSQTSNLKLSSSIGDDTHLETSRSTNCSLLCNGTQLQSLQSVPLILANMPQNMALPSIQLETEPKLPVKEFILLAMTFTKKKKNEKKSYFTSITVGTEEIYKESDYLQFIKLEKYSLTKKKMSEGIQYKLNSMTHAHSEARRYARQQIKEKTIITFGSLKIINTLNTEHPVADIRDIYCLLKFIDVIDEHYRREKFEYTMIYEELNYYFLGKENISSRNSTHVANVVKSIYDRFKNEWEIEIKHLIENGKLSQTLSPFEEIHHDSDRNIYINKHPYTGFHCDVFEFKLHLDKGTRNQHLCNAIDIEWNEDNSELLHVTKIRNSGMIIFQQNNLKINSYYYKRFQEFRISDLRAQNCRFITVGHGILKSMAKIIGPNITSYENVIDLQLQFYLHKNELMNNTLNYLVEKYLHIIVPKDPDSHMRAKMCMQLYKLYRFELGVDELWYGELIKSKKYCSEQ